MVLGDKGVTFSSRIRGKHDITRRGGFLVTEFDGCRVFETDESGTVVWEYLNRYNDEECAELSEARIYPAEYFTVGEWRQ